MPGRGLQDIPYRIPAQWDPNWFREIIRDVLAKADIRNAIEGAGITIEGQPDVPATISSSEDLLDLIEQNYILATSSSFLDNERILTGESSVVTTTDQGPGGNFVIGIATSGISDLKLRESVELSVMGRPMTESGHPQDIPSSANDTLLRRVSGTFGDELNFGQLTLPMAPDALWTWAKLQDATALSVLGRSADTDGVLDEIVAGSDDDVLRRSGTAVGFGQIVEGAIADGSILARLAANETITGSWTFPNLAITGNRADVDQTLLTASGGSVDTVLRYAADANAIEFGLVQNNVLYFLANNTRIFSYNQFGITINAGVFGIFNQNGTAANPSYTYLNDLDTGDFCHTGNKLSRATAGVARMTWKADGQVRYVPLTADPTNDVEDGDVYYNSTSNKLRIRAAGAWADLH